jgi:hypothetical protein
MPEITIGIPDESYERLMEVAAQENRTPAEWIIARLPLPSRNSGTCAQPRTMAERLAGRLGRIGSETGYPSAAEASDSVAEYLLAKQRAGRL